jgi:DNA helicase-2/ATP-dependent DNA helicase PcrA
VPYVLRGGERFFERQEIRQARAALRAATRAGDDDGDLPGLVGSVLAGLGWQPERPPAGGAARERWEALASLVRLASSFHPGTLEAFIEDLDRRAESQHVPTVAGVTLASLHSAKGLEWDAVFLVGLAEGTLPTSYARSFEALEEERRLLYVGITRARQWLWLSLGETRSAGGRARRPCRFLPTLNKDVPPSRTAAKPRAERRKTVVVSCRVCGTTLMAGIDRKLGRCAACPSTMDDDLFARLQEWRVRTAAAAKVPAYVVFTDATLTALAERQPGDNAGLLAIAGIGSRKLELYGEAVRGLLAGDSVEKWAAAVPAQKNLEKDLATEP